MNWTQCATPSLDLQARMVEVAHYTRQPNEVDISVYFLPESLTHYSLHVHENGVSCWFKSDGYKLTVTAGR